MILQETFSYIQIQPASSTVQAVKLIPAEKISGSEFNAVEAIDADVSKGTGCIFCEYILHEIVSDLQNATIEAEVKEVNKTLKSDSAEQ